MSRIAVIGAGAWGTALAMVLGRPGDHEVRLWALEKEVLHSIARSRTNDLFLPGCALPDSITATNDFKEALSGVEIIVSVMPSHHCRRTFEHMAQWLQPHMLFVSATKGIENDTLLRMTQVIHEVVGRFCGFEPKIGAISGPSFAKEVAEKHPTAVTVASADSALAARVQKDFSDPSFRVYMNEDLIGVELGGALKNVIAIAAGVCSGLGLGHNSVAALITRELAESPGSPWRAGPNRKPCLVSPAWVTWCSHAPGGFPGTAASARHWARDSPCSKLSRACMGL